MNSNKAVLIAGCIFFIALCLAIFRDLSLEKTITGDLRNRVVGARLQKDGKAPYYYNWKPGDPIRYYDPAGFVGNRASNITASPFFHTLLYPLADLQQRTISLLWLLLEYVFMLITGVLAFRLAKNNNQKIAVIIALTLFLFTEGWKVHIATGQIYLLVPFLMMIFYYCLTRRESRVAAFVAGLSAISLVLIRPNAVVFFLPFLFLIRVYSRQYLLFFLAPVILIPVLHFSFANNRLYWQQYKTAVGQFVKDHQNPISYQQPQTNVFQPEIKQWEGWDVDKAREYERTHQIHLYSEHGNVFVLYFYVFKKQLSVNMMNLLSGLSVVILLAACAWERKKHGAIALPNLAIIGLCLYMITDLLSPIWRHQYYTVQWLFALLLAAAVYKRDNKWFYAVLFAGLLLNIANLSFIKMEHSIGEYILLMGLLGLGLMGNTKPNENNRQ